MEKIVVGNLKMNLEEKDVNNYLSIINKYLPINNVDLYLSPSFIFLENFISKKFHLTAQDVSSYNDGSYTGEVSALQLKSIGVDSVIIGHSERRKIFNETDEIINDKIIKSLNNNLRVILCVGEEEKNVNYLEYILNKLEKDLVNINDFKNIIIAYEPIYAIGTGSSAGLNHIEEVVNEIKKKYDAKVIYGGSINESNINKICKITDGVIVGNSSIDAKKFVKLMSRID